MNVWHFKITWLFDSLCQFNSIYFLCRSEIVVLFTRTEQILILQYFVVAVPSFRTVVRANSPIPRTLSTFNTLLDTNPHWLVCWMGGYIIKMIAIVWDRYDLTRSYLSHNRTFEKLFIMLVCIFNYCNWFWHRLIKVSK